MPFSYDSHCTVCPYVDGGHLPRVIKSIRDRPLSLEHNGSKVLLIFQSPGIDEWNSGNPISSSNPRSAGTKLAAAFRSIGKTRSNYDITNVVQCFPGKAEPRPSTRPRDRKPLKAACNACANWLAQDIAAGEYERVVVFGAAAKDAVERLGFRGDARFVYSRHPNASGVSIAQLAESVG
jgi:uracil-DNA glycosylase